MVLAPKPPSFSTFMIFSVRTFCSCCCLYERRAVRWAERATCPQIRPLCIPQPEVHDCVSLGCGNAQPDAALSLFLRGNLLVLYSSMFVGGIVERRGASYAKQVVYRD